jgi:hypothetical protein
MEEAAEFFNRILAVDIPHIAVENPRIHKHALALLGRRADTVVQSWMFGDFDTKATGFWLKNLPPLSPMYATKAACAEALGLEPGSKPKDRCHKLPPGPLRWKLRSATYPGIAAAAAQQWADHVLNNQE